MQAMTKARREEEQESGLWDYLEAGFDMLEFFVEVAPSLVARLVGGAIDGVVHVLGAVAEVAGGALEVLGPLFELLGCLGG